MTTKHTEMPWEINENNPINIKITQKNKGTIAILPSVFTTENGYDEMKANAHLMAAAPDLLEALIYMIQCHRNPHDKEGHVAIEKALSATAKAGGK